MPDKPPTNAHPDHQLHKHGEDHDHARGQHDGHQAHAHADIHGPGHRDHGHAHGHGHGHTHGPHHAPTNFGIAFGVGIGLNIALVILQVVVGYKAGSLALLADAGHNLADALGLVLAWVAVLLQRSKASNRRTYGLRRSSILAALVNAMVLLVGMGALAWESIGRLSHPASVNGVAVMWVAGAGIVINGLSAALFLAGSRDDLNIRSAFMHLLSDAVVSLGVVIAGAIILWTGWVWVDPAMSILIVVVIVVGTWSLFRESLDLALDAAPAGLDVAAVRQYIASLPGVAMVHDFHVWAMSTTETALTAHIVIPRAGSHDMLLARIASDVQERFRIGHVTVQIESGGHPCRLTVEDAV